MVSLLITLLVACLIAGIIYWIVGLLPIPAPFKNIVMAVLGLILVLWLISYFFGGSFPENWHWRGRP